MPPAVLNQPPASPPVATPGAVPVATPVVSIPRPMTRDDVDALRAKRAELSRQLTSVGDRRKEAVRELRSSPGGAARAGLEGRITVLDQRIMQLETDIAANGQALAAAPGNLAAQESVAPTERYGPFSSGQMTGITIVSIALVGAPLAFAAAWIMIKRWAKTAPAPQLLASAARLERMEQAIDAVAIEVERISEGQRFVTQTLAARTPAAALPDQSTRSSSP